MNRMNEDEGLDGLDLLEETPGILRGLPRLKNHSAEATGKGAEQGIFRGETSVDGLLCDAGSRCDFVHLRSSKTLFEKDARGLFEDAFIYEGRNFQRGASTSSLRRLWLSRRSFRFHVLMLSYHGFM